MKITYNSIAFKIDGESKGSNDIYPKWKKGSIKITVFTLKVSHTSCGFYYFAI